MRGIVIGKRSLGLYIGARYDVQARFPPNASLNANVYSCSRISYRVAISVTVGAVQLCLEFIMNSRIGLM